MTPTEEQIDMGAAGLASRGVEKYLGYPMEGTSTDRENAVLALTPVLSDIEAQIEALLPTRDGLRESQAGRPEALREVLAILRGEQ